MYYSKEALDSLGISVGKNVEIHHTVQFFNPRKIYINNDVRIDCFAMISAGEQGVFVGSNVHIGTGSYIFGKYGLVTLEDFSGLSSRVCLFTASEDFVEGYLSNPTIPDKFKKVKKGNITLKKHALIGSGSVLMPDVIIGEGAAIGALTFVNKNVPEFAVMCGNPIRRVNTRNKERLLSLEKNFYKETNDGNSS